MHEMVIRLSRRVSSMRDGGAATAQSQWPIQTIAAGLAGAAGTLAIRAAWRAAVREDMAGKVVLITGSSRGLGLALAEEFAQLGSRLVLCARDVEELERARARIAGLGADVLAVPCDVGSKEQVDYLVQQALWRFGRVDVLVNNAGIMQVGRIQDQTIEDFHKAMDVMFWGTVHPTMALLDHMLERRSGHIANITSIGGKVSAPHLLPYSCAKFAAVAFSEGLRAELARDDISVTTVVPGFMRTGSYLNAIIKGSHYRPEFAWFSFGANVPLISMSARRAAKRIVDAVRRGKAELILTPEAQVVARFAGVFPSTTARIAALVNRALPSGERGEPAEEHTGTEARTSITRAYTVLGERAAREFLQYRGANGGNGRSKGDA